MDEIEYGFELKAIDIQIQHIEAQIASLQFEKERLNYQKIKFVEGYSSGIIYEPQQDVSQYTEYVDGIEPVATEVVENFKPRRLKKND